MFKVWLKILSTISQNITTLITHPLRSLFFLNKTKQNVC